MSIVGGILSAIGAAGQLFAGYGSVTLGPLQFQGLGKPQSMPIGGKQAITTHKLPGGSRVLDAMGPDNADIAWSGYLDGAAAVESAQTLDILRQSGQVVTLAWDVFSYQVLVSEFRCDIQHIPMPYRIMCTVVSDNSQVDIVSAVGLALQVTADLSQANALVLSATSQAIIGASVSAAGNAIAIAGATTVGSAAYVAAVNAVNTATIAIGAVTDLTNAMLLPVGLSLGSLSAAAPVAVDTAGMSNDIVVASAACGDMAQLASVNGYVSRAAVNLLRASA